MNLSSCIIIKETAIILDSRCYLIITAVYLYFFFIRVAVHNIGDAVVKSNFVYFLYHLYCIPLTSFLHSSVVEPERQSRKTRSGVRSDPPHPHHPHLTQRPLPRESLLGPHLRSKKAAVACQGSSSDADQDSAHHHPKDALR